jgi:hypothetical protein
MPRQISIPGTDIDNPVIADLIERWLEACERAKAASEKKQELDDAIVVTMLRLGVAYHPFTDPDTGKRKYRVVDTTPRGKSIAARPQAAEDMKADEPSESESTPAQGAVQRLRDALPDGATMTVSVGGRSAKLSANKVESRKVSRKAAAKEIAERDAKVKAEDAGQSPDVGEFRQARDWDEADA